MNYFLSCTEFIEMLKSLAPADAANGKKHY
jgi:hypothetical protein